MRPRLIERLNEGVASGCQLTLVSAPAGFGKSTLVSEWVFERMKDEGGRRKEGENHRPSSLTPALRAGASVLRPSKVAWLSLDERDNDPTRFLTYLVAALRTILADIGAGVLAALQAPQPPPAEALLTVLINEIITTPESFILVLDDYHSIEAKPVNDALAFLVEHLPAQMHLVIATREDPQLPLARLRVRGQLTELRAADLRFTPSEAAEFLNRAMGLNLSADDIAALDARTEGWIAGLHLAAISMQGQRDTAGFIKSFTGSHHFVLDYLVEEVLQQQPESIQTFLLRTSILERMCGPQCDAILLTSVASGQEALEYLERANLFIVPLDNERRWYRYHHLFGELLLQRLLRSASASPGVDRPSVTDLHIRASAWYEANGLGMEAFHHAAAANDVERAERLISGGGMPLHYRGAVNTILDWLGSLPKPVKDARPALWVRSATLSLVAGQATGVEESLRFAEAGFEAAGWLVEPDGRTRDLLGQIACARATLALTRYQPETMIAQARRALAYLNPDDLPFRFTAFWTLAYAHLLLGDRAEALRAVTEAVAISQASGDSFSTMLAAGTLGEVQEMENDLHAAAETYRGLLQLIGDHPQPNACEAQLGLARIYYEWNDLDAADQHGQQSLQLARQYDKAVDRFILSEVFLARLKLARGDVAGATAMLAETAQSVHQNNFVRRLPEVAAVQVLTLLRQGDVAAAARLVQTHDLPISQVRVFLAQGDAAKALAVLEPLRQQMDARGWQDARLKVMVLQAVALHAAALHADREKDKAVQALCDALVLAQGGGFIRLFLDEGAPMAELLSAAAARGIMPDYVGKLLAAFQHVTKDKERTTALSSSAARPSSLIEPLSQRELEVLRLIAQGLSNQEIGDRLFLALNTVKGHNRVIFDKLQVQNRTEAVARARELGLL
jgi:LuxR family transcriptional regulator, maltose regulon positive regulatory protein